MFHNAHNFSISGGEFSNVQKIVEHDDVSTTLWKHVAAAAMFDSAERYPPGRCYPDTRMRIIDKINDWINDHNSERRILWLYGSAGAGKSALMQSICELLRDSNRRVYYAGSFFFARGRMDRGKGIKLFTTLAYQLAVQFPSVRTKINEALRHDPSISTKSIDIQLRSLIIDPLLNCETFPPQHPILFIDGLDECDDDQGVDTQSYIITLISKSIMENNISVRFVVASRPEYWIRDAFETSPLLDITFPLSLRTDIDADEDIQAYLTKEFDAIRMKNRRIMHSVELPWPGRKIIHRFVEEASGQYLYATTILKFVGNFSRFSDPVKQLRIITNPGPHRATAFSELDRLYATILSAYPDWEPMRRVLGGLLLDANLPIIEGILKVNSTEITLILDALRSLIEVDIPPPLSEHETLLESVFGTLSAGTENISFSHLSFREFLQDESRSGPWFVNIQPFIHAFTGTFFNNIILNLRQNYQTEPQTAFTLTIIQYRRVMGKLAHLAGRSPSLHKFSKEVNKLTNLLKQLDPTRKMNNPGCFLQDIEWIKTMCKEAEYRRHYLDSTLTNRGDFRSAVQNLKTVASSARRVVVTALSRNNNPKVTSVLISIDAFRNNAPIVGLFATISGDDDVGSILHDIYQHRHMIQFRTSYSGWYASIIDPLLNPLGGVHLDGGWFPCSHYRNELFAFVSALLTATRKNFENACKDPLSHSDRATLLNFVGSFFNDATISDIWNKEYFEAETNVFFLRVMLDPMIWKALIPTWPVLWESLSITIAPILCWFGRKLLMDQFELQTIGDYDPSLPQKMTKAMNSIFQHCFMPIFTTPFFSELVISTVSSGEDESVRIRVKAKDSSYVADKIAYYLPCEGYGEQFCNATMRVHELLFTGNPPIIPQSHWYPTFAAYLLNVLVKELYWRIKSKITSPEDPGPWARPSRYTQNIIIMFPSIVTCLPFAQTTTQNLDALRVTKCLTSQLTTERWHPPQGYCSATLEFLKKYKSHVLSPSELYDLELWLVNMDEFDTERVKEAPDEALVWRSESTHEYLNKIEHRTGQYTYRDYFY